MWSVTKQGSVLNGMSSRRHQIDFSERLVAEVEKVPMIYNQNDPDYKVKNKTDIAWSHIADVMDSTVDICKTKWGNLRGTYSKHLVASRQDLNKPPIWYLFHHMSFLEPYMQHTSLQYQFPPSQVASQQDFDDDGRHAFMSSPPLGASPTSSLPVKSEMTDCIWRSDQARGSPPTTAVWPLSSQFPSRKRKRSTPPISEHSSRGNTPTPLVSGLEHHMSEDERTTTAHRGRNKRLMPDSNLTELEAAAASFLVKKEQQASIEENPNLTFLRGLLPLMAEFNTRNLRKFQRHVFNLAHDMLDEQEKEQNSFL